MEEVRSTAVIATTVAVTVALTSLARFALWPEKKAIIPGPLSTGFHKLSKDELARVPYSPDTFPGARDVVTPYGNIRVYEFGPEDGRKVLFIHGISTSCMTLKDIAIPLAEKGCRVMLFDLFGRGFSDAPGDVPYDTRLFVTQILLVLASSSLSWTGDNGLHVVGYSLGGGIAANFAATFPNMVETLILLAPAGLIRPENFGGISRLIFTSGIVPERILSWITKYRLRQPIASSVSKKVRMSISDASTKAPLKSEHSEDYVDLAIQEAIDPVDEPPQTPFEIQVMDCVHWTLDAHKGFVQAFMSTIRYAPLMDQHDYWRQLAKRKPGTTAVLLGKNDNMIQRDDYTEDALPLLGGKENVYWRVVPGSHNFPFTHGSQALERIYEFWGME
ncbi:alpha/beta-hydrolase [Annulohypoxylon maeteangense]|uniref:alpha/beta-hydrolase n=1 Tax=Annulohypoxylon maeteangense TaxID=1927788 RepID=UPI002008CDB4|nr:alpha/beta-hydrolase [Annulohypoxylon maeteangense]KAI0890014.1 alpha/beta-hydrolase [Annulohypoxylon maeteangense]